MKKIITIFALAVLILCGTFAFIQSSKADSSVCETIQAKNFNYLLGTLNGISDEVLRQHFKLYEGYVNSLNNLNDKLKRVKDKTGNATYSDYRAINISKPFAQNGVVLHELYFSNLSGKESCPSAILAKYLTRDFGSFNAFISELKEAAKSARSGWVITAYNNRDAKIYNYIIDLHDEHVPISVIPLLVFDVWEHAYMVDYGIDKASYIEAFVKNIDWGVVSERLESVGK